MKFITPLLPLLSVTSVLSATIAPEPNQTPDLLPTVSLTPLAGRADITPSNNSTLVEEKAHDCEANLFAALTRDYSISCRNYSIVNLRHFPRLYRAECRSRSGSWGRSDLSLPSCLANSDGRLVEQNKYGLPSISHVVVVYIADLHFVRITCNCKDCGGNWKSASYNLDNVLGNDDGVLGCYNHRGF
ncbi:hypothetical protein LZ30DRAFT_683464 [Colletotrichum cereale]|nr:hypothetical protein LZ30DRAFT_683464 [Colletotrichum cereale]